MRVILTALFVLFTAATASTYSAAEIPLTSDGHGGTVRWVDQAKTGIKIPVGTKDTLICDPRLLAIARTKGISLGNNCIRLFNDGSSPTNYIATTDETFGNFISKFSVGGGEKACDVIPNPWTIWSGPIPVASTNWLDPSLCGVQGYTEQRVCTEPIHSCSNTCEGTGSTFTEYRPASVDNGSASIWSPTGATEVARGATCYQPDTTTYDEINNCAQPRTRTINCTLIPSTPNLIVPTVDLDGAYTISWGAVAGGATYQVVGEGSSTIYNGGGTSSARSMPTGIYSYKVRACSAPANGKGAVCSPYSAEQTIRVDITPAIPSISTPATSANGSYTVSWGAVAGSSTYKLYEGSALVHDSAVRSKGFSNRITGVYSYKLRACNILGTCSPYSAVKTTRVSRIPAAPSLTAPSADADGSYPISWGSVTHGSTYQLYEGSALYYNSTGQSVNISGRMTANYEYKVRSCNTLGDCGAFSVVKTVRVSRIPSSPALTVPANDADGSYSVSWGAVTHATTYQLVEGSSTVHNSSTRSKGFNGKNSAVYSYKVRSCNALGDCGAYSAVKTTRVSRIPSAPALTVPANDADGSYSVSWGAVTHATTYQLVEGSSTVHNSSTRSKGFSGKNSAVYSYKVRSCNALGDCGAYSAVKTTRVSRIPSAPALTVPADDTDGSYTVSWGAVTHATTYQLYEGGSRIHNSSARSKGISGKLTGTYGYKVRACNAVGDCGAFSGTKNTRVSRTPAVPSLSVPANDADGSYTISWGAATHAATYQLYEGSSLIHNSSARSKGISGKLTGTYGYKVRACNAYGACSGFSGTKNTRVSRIPAAPSLSVPANDADGSYTVSWGAVTHATTYQLYEGGSLIHNSSARSKGISGKLTGTYGYKVRACNALGDCGAFSGTANTKVSRVPAAPTLAALAEWDADGTYWVSWGAVTHATTYQLYEGGSQIQNASALSRRISGKLTGSYSYKVRACNAYGACSGFSGTKTTRVSRIPAVPSLSVPANDADGSYTISWGAATHAATYQLYEGSSLIHNSSARSKGISGKLTGTYGYKVRACNAYGACGAFSGTANTKVSRVPAAPTLAALAEWDGDGTYWVSWGAVTHATTYQLYEGGSQIQNASALSRRISGKLTGSYSYKVRACNAYGACSGFSGTKTTRVSRIPAVPSLSVPANDADGSYTISWGAATHAATYQLYEGSSLIHNSSARSKGISGKLTGTYGYKVRACNAYGACSGFSGTKNTRVSRIPAVPSLSVPANDADGSYTISWGAATHAATYQLYEGSSLIHNSSARSKGISGKLTGPYGYKVRACNAYGACSGFSAVKTTVVNITPGAFTCSAPPNDGDGSYAVSWGAVPGAATYQLYEGSSLIHSGGGSSKSISGKLTGNYAYQGRSCNSYGTCSSMASCGSTRVSRTPAVPALAALPEWDGDGTYWVSWGAVTHATTYQLYEGGSQIQNSSALSRRISGKLTGTYGYKVRACNAYGACSGFSGTNNIKVSLQPGTPTLTAPSTDGDGSYTVSWSAAYQATSYKLYEIAMGYTTLKQHSSSRSMAFSGKTSRTYSYKVSACNALGGCGPFSATKSVVVSTCDSNAWTPNNGLTVAQTAQTCTTGSTFNYSETNGCGGTRTNTYPCAGCDANVWSCTYGYGRTIAQCAAACNAPSTFPITNGCGGTVYSGGSAGQCTGTPPPPPEPQWSAWMGISNSYRFYHYKSYSGAVLYQKAYWNGALVYNFSFGGGGGAISSWVHGGYRYERGGAKQGPYSFDYTTYQIRRKAL